MILLYDLLQYCQLEQLMKLITYVSVDEGSYKPDDQLKKVRDVAEETLNIVHSMKLIKTKKEAEDNSQSDDD